MKPSKTILFVLLTVLLGFVLPAYNVQAAQKLPSGLSYEAIGSEIENFVNQHKETTAGMETAIITADETLYEGHFGYMDKVKGLKADEGSVNVSQRIFTLSAFYLKLGLYKNDHVALSLEKES